MGFSMDALKIPRIKSDYDLVKIVNELRRKIDPKEASTMGMDFSVFLDEYISRWGISVDREFFSIIRGGKIPEA